MRSIVQGTRGAAGCSWEAGGRVVCGCPDWSKRRHAQTEASTSCSSNRPCHCGLVLVALMRCMLRIALHRILLHRRSHPQAYLPSRRITSRYTHSSHTLCLVLQSTTLPTCRHSVRADQATPTRCTHGQACCYLLACTVPTHTAWNMPCCYLLLRFYAPWPPSTAMAELHLTPRERCALPLDLHLHWFSVTCVTKPAQPACQYGLGMALAREQVVPVA